MTQFTKIADQVDVSLLNMQIDANPHLWNQFGMRRTASGSPHTEMSDIWVRYNDVRPFIAKGSFAGFNDEHESLWYPAYAALPALKRIVFPLMTLVEGERLGGVLITKIPPGGGIAPHRDAGWHVNHYDKFYVSLKSAPGAEFCCPGETLNPKVGEIYRFDNRIEHWVKNESAHDRVTLIVCIRTDLFEKHARVSAAVDR